MIKTESSYELYNDVSNRITQESDAYMGHLISRIAGNSDVESQYSWIDHELRMIALRSLRISTVYELATPEKLKYYAEEINSDYENLIKSIESVEYKGKIDEEVVSDAFDCIVATLGSKNVSPELINCIPEEYRRITPSEEEISEDLYFLLTSISDFYFLNLYQSAAIQVLLYLVGISKKRNKNTPDRHRKIVVEVLARLTDVCLDECYHIYTSERDCFKGFQDEYTADFLWFSGCILQGKGKTESARNIFYNCYKIRRQLYGEECWYTALARREYSILTLLLGDNEQRDSYNFLLRFVNTIEEGGYKEVDRNTLETIEGKTLYTLLLYKLNNNDFYSYQHYLSIFGVICDKYNEAVSEPLIKLRLKNNLLGSFHLKTGNYIQAEQAFLDAINAKFPDGAEEILSEAQAKSNLLMAYYVENDLEHATPLLLDLLELIDVAGSGLTKQDEYRILTLNNSLISQSFIELDDEDAYNLKKELEELYLAVYDSDLLKERYASGIVVFIITSVQLLVQNNRATSDDCKKYLDLLLRIENCKEVSLDDSQEVVLCLVLSTLAWELDDCAASKYIEKAVMLVENAVIPMSTRAAVLQTAATILSKQGKINVALTYLKRSLRHITDIWHSYMRYSNDSRLLQILSPTQLIFSCCYAIMREQDNNAWALYEKVLQYKALASLAGKERNRLINAGLVDKGLVNRIKVIQDRVAAIEAENVFLAASREYEKEKEHLRKLEAQFAMQFPDNINLTQISINDLMEKMPDNAAVVEYYLCAKEYGRRQADDDADALVYDVFVLKKVEGQCSLQKVVISHAERISEEAIEFLDVLQDESKQKATISQLERKEILRVSLYNSLIEPISSLLIGIKRIFVAPDGDIINLPFDILSGESGEQFGDSFNIVKMECARDFLFGSEDSTFGCGSLIIGNPQFQVRDKAIYPAMEQEGPDRTRFVELKAENIRQLPFSELEVQMVGKYCGSTYLTGPAAKRKRLLCGGSNRNIHLATHGYYDLAAETDTIFSSCLLLAGVKNWLQTHVSHDEYGNGIVTADEISRLDFHKVEVVVLSSCLGGMNDAVLSKGFHGLIGGFSAAGVKYVISNLWSADDLGTAILMDAFYYQYMTKNLAPPAALKKAQKYLRKVTIGELKNRKWFEYMLQSDVLDSETKDQVSMYMSKNERYRPFKNEIYWAGFTCFRCN